jgi:probable rRNA maturation factor
LTYRAQDKPTNVLSFAFEPPPGYDSAEPYIGDLVLCADVVAAEAEQQLKIPAHHWAHLVIHGTLHLLGFDHEAPAAAADMEQLETQLLSQLNINNPYEIV